MEAKRVKRNQQVKLFLLLILCTTYIFAFSHLGSNALEAYSSTNDAFSEGTTIGPIDLSGKSKEEAIVYVTTQVNQWISNATIEFNYRDKTLPFETGNFIINIAESVESVKDGQTNPLLVQIDTEELQKTIVLLAPSITVTEELETDLLSLAQSLQVTSTINIDNYLSAVANTEVLSTVKVELDSLEANLDNLTEIIIPAESAFSLSEFLTDSKRIDAPSEFLNLLSSGIYQLILQSNFTLQERHIGAELPDKIPLGYEAKIDTNLGWDFAFNNPNKEEFTIKISQQEGYLQLDLVGYPFVNSYQVELSNEQSFEPKIIKRYDPLLKPGETRETATGENGLYVEVYRKILSENGDWIGEELISKDFYAPQHRVEIVGLNSLVVEIEDTFEEDEFSNSEDGTNLEDSEQDLDEVNEEDFADDQLAEDELVTVEEESSN
jgi:hypothetical protein